MRLRALGRLRGRLQEASERGATLALVAVAVIIVLTAGAVAVDVSAMDRQGQALQNTADAAALAGVDIWVESGDQVAALGAIEDLIEQNGIDIGSEYSLDVQFVSETELTVNITDNNPEAFLRGFVGAGDELERDASAELEQCEEGCTQVIEIPPPLGALLAKGSGDGYRPIPVGERMYSVNHHESTMACVDRITQNYCWSDTDRDLFSSEHWTMNQTHGHTFDGRIYYIGHSESPWGEWRCCNTSATPYSRYSRYYGWWYERQFEPDTGYLRVGCFDTTTDSRCGTYQDIWNEGQGVMAGIGDRVFVFTNARKVHCYQLPSMSTCAGYGGGKDTALSAENDYYWDVHRIRSWNSDRKILNGRIYTVLSRVDDVDRHAQSSYVQEIKMHCWDSNTDAPCAGFGRVSLHSGDSGTSRDWAVGRLFFYRDSDGVEQAICSTGLNNVQCFDLNSGSSLPSYAGTMNNTVGQIQTFLSGGATGYYVGRHTYHEPTNRLFMVGNFLHSTTHCHDFNTGQFCGEEKNVVPWSTMGDGGAGTYVFHAETNCLIGLGHEAIFFSMKPDMTGECDGSASSVDVEPCICGDELKWPPLMASNVENVGEFLVRIVDPEGNVVYPPEGHPDDADGDGFVDVLDNPIDFDPFVPDDYEYDYVTVEVGVNPDGSGIDPWLGEPPSLLVGIEDEGPKLVE